MRSWIWLPAVAAAVLILGGCKAEPAPVPTEPPVTQTEETDSDGFRDVVDFNGNVVDVQYYSVPGEISLTGAYTDSTVTVTAVFTHTDRFPCVEAETLRVGAFVLLNDKGETAASEGLCEPVPLQEGRAVMQLSVPNLDRLPPGDYTLKVDHLVSEKKADRPLEIFGDWEIPLKK